LPTGFEVQEVFAANNSTFILKTDGTLLAVGSDYGHMLGDGDNSTACHTEILTLSDNVSAFTASGGNTLYGKTDGTVWGAGYNYTSTDHGIIPSALGQGPSSATYYVSFVEIPLIDED
jgi:alpha-tubulin suppressor-like RCC1 family protein